jgi:chromate reductase, NAD(P)H dehydrogenase (quinone)
LVAENAMAPQLLRVSVGTRIYNGPAFPQNTDEAIVSTEGASMSSLLGLSGSLRAGSFNTALLRAAAGLMPAGSSLEVATLHGIPLYDGDVEARDGIPAAVHALKERIVACDGLVLATPEYNNGMPGVLKNGIDWLSRPAADIGRVFGDRPVAVFGASPGSFGTILAQNGWLPVLRTLGTRPWFGGRLMVSRAGQVFDESGEMVDEKMRSLLQQFLQGFVASLRR